MVGLKDLATVSVIKPVQMRPWQQGTSYGSGYVTPLTDIKSAWPAGSVSAGLFF